jgi:hypothetical protein
MKPEEYLDGLIERREHGQESLPVANDEIAARLAAAQALTQLREIDIPPELARRLELCIRTRAQDLARQNGRSIPLSGPLKAPGSGRFQLRRACITALRIAAVLLMACTGILTVSPKSLPGDALYGLKQAEYQFRLTLADNPQDRVSIQIDQLHSALVDLNTVVNDGHDDNTITLALNSVATNTTGSRSAVAALPAGSEREAAQGALDGVLAEEEQTLRHLLGHVDWPVRLAFTQQLGTLGDPVPIVTHVTVLTQSNGTLLITLTGTHIAPQAELVINGQPEGTVSQSTPVQLVAVISTSVWPSNERAFGVRNPDGTAAQMIFNGDDNEPKQQNSDPGRHGTPDSDGE